MKFLNTPITIVLALTGTFQPAVANYRRCVDSYDESRDYFPNKVTPMYSKQWSIEYHNSYKIITNKAAQTSYLLYQCGTPPPAGEAGKHEMTISVPLQGGLAVSSTTMIPHIQQLGLRRQIKAYMGDPQYLSAPCVHTMLDEGAIEIVFDVDSYYKQGTNFTDYLVGNPDIVALKNFNSGSNAFVISEFTEEENLDIYEWHKVYASLFNLEETANKQFAEAEERFLCTAHNADFIANNRDSGMAKPTVAWARYVAGNPDWGTVSYWDVARCDEKNLYYCEYATMCSAELLHSNEGSIENSWTEGDYHMTDEEFFAFAKDADYWIYTGFNWDATYEALKDELDKLKSVKNEEVYDVMGSGQGSWFEDRVAEFDVVLQDFCEVVGHYDDVNEVAHERMFFRKVLGDDKESLPSDQVCEAGFIDIPWETRASECVRLESEVDTEEGTSTGYLLTSKKVAFMTGLASMIAVMFV